MTDYQKGLVGYTVSRAPVEQKPMLPLADFEKDTISYFFAKMKLTDQRFYDQSIPDANVERITKRDYANQIRYMTNEQIDSGFVALRKLMAANHPDYRFLTIPKIIGVCDGTAQIKRGEGVQAGAHRVLPKALPEPPEYKTKRYQKGISETSALLAMLDDKPKAAAPTQAELDDLNRLERIKNGKL
jgi:hypothetical protein